MYWYSEGGSTGVRAHDPKFGVTLSVAEAGDGWWHWHAEHEGTPWTPDARWFATRVDAQDAAEAWAATVTKRHLALFRRLPRAHLKAA